MWCYCTQTLSWQYCGWVECKGDFVKWESLRRNPDGRRNSEWWNPDWMFSCCKYNAPCTVSYSLPSKVSSIIHSTGPKKCYGADVSDSIGLKTSNYCVWYWDVHCRIVELFWRDTVAWWGTEVWQISWDVNTCINLKDLEEGVYTDCTSWEDSIQDNYCCWCLCNPNQSLSEWDKIGWVFHSNRHRHLTLDFSQRSITKSFTTAFLLLI